MPLATGRLSADVDAGHRDSQCIHARVDLAPGGRLAVTGASGSGKTTLLMTLAGLLPALRGQVLLDGTALDQFDEVELRSAVSFFAEDAHVFATTVRDNLLVARGDCADEELDPRWTRSVWADGWPACPRSSTVLTAGAQAVSAGQRRRLLLARAVISPARIVLLDEPTEHLDAADAELVLRDLLAPECGLMSSRTIVVATHHLPKDIRCAELPLTGVAGAA